MGVTISTHNGSAVAREHNIRNPKVTSKESHIDPNGTHETWIDEKPKVAYQRLFGAAVEDYNAKQKRSDRKITDYYQQICEDKKKHPVYEMIIAVGDRTDYTDGKLDEKTAKSILREFVDGWQERNPHLALIGAYYHADEQGAPHAHLDYIPVASGYKRGLETQSALVKALEQQGFSKEGKETAQIQWQRRENAHLESLCLSKGIEVIHPRIADRQHLDTTVYKKEQQAVQAEQRAATADKELATAKAKLKTTHEKYKSASRELKTVLDQKSRASEIKTSHIFGETVSYHKSMLEDTRAIGSESYEQLIKAQKIREEVIEREQAVTALEQAVKPLFNKARQQQTQAQRELQQAQQIKKTMEQEVERRATELTDQRMKRMFGEVAGSRAERLEDFCDSVKYSDGQSVLDKFEEQEKQLKLKKRRRDMSL